MLLVIWFFHFQFINLEKVISEFFKMCSNVWKLGAGFVITNSTDYSNVVDPDLIRTQSKEYFCFLFKGYVYHRLVQKDIPHLQVLLMKMEVGNGL